MANPLAADLDAILEVTEPLWDDLRGERLFITGGTGFFGCWLLESFLWANNRLQLKAAATVLTRNPEAFRARVPHIAGNPAVTLATGDVRSFEFPRGDFSHVIHAATDSSHPPGAELLRSTIVDGTERSLEFAQRVRAKKLLFTSSGAVYGKQPSDVMHIDEDFAGSPRPDDPNSAYGAAKLHAEQRCIEVAESGTMEVKIARCFAFVGPYMDLDVHFAVGNFMRDQMRGGPISIKGDGTAFRSYLYASDLAIWLWTILFRGKSGRAYNVGSENAVSIRELADVVAAIGPERIRVEIAGQPSGKPPDRYVPGTKRARMELGLTEWVPLQEAIRRSIEWYRHKQ